jgi:biotin operon repressor
MSQTEIDRYSVADLEERLGISRSNVYKRLDALNIKGEKVGGKVFFNADQYQQLKALNLHILKGGTLTDYPPLNNGKQAEPDLSRPSQDKLVVSRETQDKVDRQMETAIALSGVLDTIASKVIAMLPTPSEPMPEQPDPLAQLRQLQEVCDRGWLLSSSQLAPLLNRQSLPSGDSFERFGFRFSRSGKNGSESAWRIEKL